MQKLNLPDRLHMRPARVSDKIFIETLYKATRDENYSYSGGLFDFNVDSCLFIFSPRPTADSRIIRTYMILRMKFYDGTYISHD
jgi:hypothetical protein